MLHVDLLLIAQHHTATARAIREDKGCPPELRHISTPAGFGDPVSDATRSALVFFHEEAARLLNHHGSPSHLSPDAHFAKREAAASAAFEAEYARFPGPPSAQPSLSLVRNYHVDMWIFYRQSRYTPTHITKALKAAQAWHDAANTAIATYQHVADGTLPAARSAQSIYDAREAEAEADRRERMTRRSPERSRNEYAMHRLSLAHQPVEHLPHRDKKPQHVYTRFNQATGREEYKMADGGWCEDLQRALASGIDVQQADRIHYSTRVSPVSR